VLVSDVLACSSIIHVVDALILASPSSSLPGGVYHTAVAFLTAIKALGETSIYYVRIQMQGMIFNLL